MRVTFSNHINDITGKAIKGVDFSINFNIMYHVQVTVYILITTPHLYYDDILYAQLSNMSFSSKMKAVQNSIAITMKEPIKGLSRGKL